MRYISVVKSLCNFTPSIDIIIVILFHDAVLKICRKCVNLMLSSTLGDRMLEQIISGVTNLSKILITVQWFLLKNALNIFAKYVEWPDPLAIILSYAQWFVFWCADRYLTSEMTLAWKAENPIQMAPQRLAMFEMPGSPTTSMCDQGYTTGKASR